jgi:signal transduction histidine kinase
VREFDDLNQFVEGMTRKAIRDYENVKEFAENASHEIKTPLAIVQGKLELLEGTDLNQTQHEYVEASHRSIKKLSKLSTSLGLLTKIENQEFEHKEPVNFSAVIEESLQAFRELVVLNGLEVKSDITPKVMIQMHPVLAHVLWTNLFQNAIKHNTHNGMIDIRLTEEKLVVKNTGPAPSTEPQELFKRFKKSEPNTDSIGLGLSIVKRIATRSGFVVSYRYTDEALHKITLWFKESL